MIRWLKRLLMPRPKEPRLSIKVRLFKHGKHVASFGMNHLVDPIVRQGESYTMDSLREAEFWDGYEADYAYTHTIDNDCAISSMNKER